MPDFWEFPTVSMGLGPICAIYQARFMRYLEDRGLKKRSDSKVWAFLGDGETDEPESLGAITLASREKLDNLIFVINCNLQRLDGPVRGNGQIIQELEAIFRGAGWNVIKVIWGSEWDPLLEKDHDGLLVKRMGEIVDGEYQKYAVESGAYVRQHFWGADPKLLEMVKHLSDEQLKKLTLGGHDPMKVYAAYKAAVEHTGQPTVILARTIKGYGIGEAGEGKNITHQQKKLNEDELRAFRTRFGVPIADDEVAKAPFYRPSENSPEITYVLERRKQLGGFVPNRVVQENPLETSTLPELFAEFHTGSDGRKASSTMAFVRMLAKLLKDKEIGKLIVPIVPDEARTFGMEALFRQVGIYSHVGQLYEPVDMDVLLYYKEMTAGQILEEGITEAGSMSSFIAAGTAYATHGINTIPFFIYYSMFGMQRIGDLVWAAADNRTRGFMLGGTAGRTTLAGEGLQHQDGHSHLLSLAVPNLISYDPAFAYEIAVIIEEGIRRMYKEGESVFYYITVMNEQYEMPPMPEGVREGILKGMYRCASREEKGGTAEGAAPWQRCHPQRDREGAGDSCRAVPGRRRRMERNELSGALPGRSRDRAMESPASRGEAAGAVRDAVPRQRGRGVRCRFGLRQGTARCDRPVAAAPAHVPRYRRFRPQREPHGVAGLLRGGCEVHHDCHARRPGEGWKDRQSGGYESHLGFWCESRKTEPSHFMTASWLRAWAEAWSQSRKPKAQSREPRAQSLKFNPARILSGGIQGP